VAAPDPQAASAGPPAPVSSAPRRQSILTRHT
jgi:hypothetical protein